MVFDKYAKYYDVLYSDIDYKKDCIRIREMTDKYFINTKKRISLVDLGCGSGTHSLIFNNMGFDVIGVDSSEQMIDIARKKNNNNIFYVGDIANFTLSKQVDIAVSLGQITSYLITDEKLDSFFKTTYANVVDGGLFIFAIPITAMIFGVAILFSLPALGVNIHPFFLQPIFALWVIFVGILFSVCVFMRQFFVLVIATLLSFLSLFYVYLMYVIQ